MEQNERRKRRKPPKWPKFLIGFLVLALIAGVIAFVATRTEEKQDQEHYEVQVTMNGDREMTLEYGTEFVDPGATGQRWNTEDDQARTDMEVQVDSNLNPDKLGSYTITYSVEYKGNRDSETRTVHIVDTQAPEITLTADPEHTTPVGQEYQEEGYAATDNYDGDITDQVERRVEDGTVIYSVADSSGNRTEVVRQILYHDPEPPTLSLKGDKKITITAGNKWSEPGYTASDNVDGDLTASVKIKGSVDIYSAGTYELTYQVTDSYGNTASAKRTVVVMPIKQPDVTEQEGKVIYLTFDDGPGKYTEQLLAVLKKYNVKATFFVCKTGYLDLLDDIAQAGHAIGIHSLSHDYKTIYSSEEAFFNDIKAMQDIIYQYSGVKTTLMRFPGGSSNGVSKKYCEGIMTRLSKAVQDQGFQYVDWNVDSDDAGGAKTADEVFQNVTDGIKNSKKNFFVVLQHDIRGFSVDAVERIIVWGLNNGYTFLPLDPSSPTCHHSINN